MLKDSPQRVLATDPSQSFIVQAPAGSGKTEILTQRYLRLLGRVSAPEQIIALTFTTKAASEMRERILLALSQVAKGISPNSAHQQLTYSYAALALERSKKLEWQLLEQPSRLRIITIDSLCQMLCQAIPLHERQVPYAQINDRPHSLYKKAAQACLAYALANENLHQPLKQLLIHLDNRQDRFLELLAELLANREQWLNNLYFAKEQSKASYEKMIALIEAHELKRFQQALPLEYRRKLCQLSQQVACIEAKPDSPRNLLTTWGEFDQINSALAASLASLLLTSQNSLRKGFDHHVGLKRGSCPDQIYEQLKADSKALLTALADEADFLEALLKVKSLPKPHYDPEQWQMLQALFTLLPVLVGHLHLIFNEHNEVDFSAISQQALLALGEEEQPTDLALYLDHSIHHLLVDEFQDTSIQQFQLISKLVQGWLPDEGRTLFVVGDPMQSIYRFRQAEVGLFLKAQQEGIGAIKLNNLELSCNFRSSSTIVSWVNEQFKTIFPKRDDMESGAVSFHSAEHVLGIDENSFIKAGQYADRKQEADALVALVVTELAKNPTDEIAILVRSRSQLNEIMGLLRAKGIAFQGVDIELLSKLPHLGDLWSLTQALLMPANRLAWLALLRSPFCGLTLEDLHAIANVDKKKSIYQALAHSDKINLSEDGRLRVQFFYSVLHQALANRHQQSLVDWLASTFKQLQSEHILNRAQQDDLEQFWLLLERFSQQGTLPDLELFKKDFDKLYSQRVNPSRLQIMTIHKSKGLEFDLVILPSLGSKSQTGDRPLLRWLKLPSQQHGELFLVSPIKAAHHQQCSLYDYLGKLDAEKEAYELQRLLYVAVTRAKKRLFLFDSNEKENKGSFRGLLKNQEFLDESIEIQESEEKPCTNPLYRLPSEYYLKPVVALGQAGNTSPLPIATPTIARLQGIVAHELLQWLCDNHVTQVEELPWGLVLNQFKSLGFDKEEQEQASKTLKQQMTHFCNDPIGQWLSKTHQDEKNEYQLLVKQEEKSHLRIIDRTFISEGVRWIIDFKTGNEEKESQAYHHQQVNDYARLFQANFSEPICCGLYYLASGNWLQWDYSKEVLELPLI